MEDPRRVSLEGTDAGTVRDGPETDRPVLGRCGDNAVVGGETGVPDSAAVARQDSAEGEVGRPPQFAVPSLFVSAHNISITRVTQKRVPPSDPSIINIRPSKK